MKKSLLLTASFLFSVSLAYSQTIRFEQVYDYDWAEAARDVQQTTDGGYVMTGRQGITIGHSRIFVTKTDSLGREEWHRFYGYPFGNQAYAIRQTQDEGYIVAGYTTGDQISVEFADIYILRLNSVGDTLWTNTYGGELSEKTWDFELLKDGSLIICGWRKLTDSTGIDGYLLKIDTQGNLEWEKTYGTSRDEQFFEIEVLDDGGFILAGSKDNISDGDRQVWMLRTNAIGDSLWSKTYGWDGTDLVNGLKVLDDGGYIIAGATASLEPAYFYDILMIRTNSIGDTLWTKVISNGDRNCAAWGVVALDEDKGFTIVVTDYNTGETHNTFLVNTDNNGNPIWTQEFQTEKSDYVYSLIQTTDKGFAFAGGTGNANTPSAFLVKTDHKGRLISSTKLPLTAEQTYTIYPNPSTGVFYITAHPLLPSDTKIEVYNQLGQLLMVEKLTPTFSALDLTTYPTGVYYLRLRSNDHGTVTRKLIISGRE